MNTLAPTETEEHFSHSEPLEQGETLPSGETLPLLSESSVREPERFTGHRVQLRVYEGPLDLLLYLVRMHRCDICDIPIRDVTAQFLSFVKLMKELDLEYAGDFLVTAASLMQIKSRMLLPKHESENEDALEDENEADPRRALVERLLEYQRFQSAAETLREMRDERAQLFTRPPLAPDLAQALAEANGASTREEVNDGAVLLRDVSTFDLLRALQKVLDRMEEAPVATIRREPFSLPERLKTLMRRLASTREGLSFGALCEDCQSRLEIVITFLAVLEMIARKKAVAVQRELFDEIWIEAAVEG